MNIIIVGCGNVGATLAEQLSQENHHVTMIENERVEAAEQLAASHDVMAVMGTGASTTVLKDAGVENADLVIAVTGHDELNLLACVVAKNAGAKDTIARVSNPEYSKEIATIKKTLGLSMVINPQSITAKEMSGLLKYPSAKNFDSFVRSRVDIVSFALKEKNPLIGRSLRELSDILKGDILIPIVERDDQVIIPDGNFELYEGDIVSVMGSTENMVEFVDKMKMPRVAARDAMILGGGRTTYYLGKVLIQLGVKVKVIEKDRDRANLLSELLPKATVIEGDATDKNLLLEEGIDDMDAIVATTKYDEENLMLSFYAKKVSNAKVITKIHRTSYDEVIDDLDLDSVVYPRQLTAEVILKYVRAKNNSADTKIETLYRLNDNQAEALEFEINEGSPLAGKVISEIDLKLGVIIGTVNHKGLPELAKGHTKIEQGDTIVIITTRTGITDIKDAIR